LNAIVAIFIIIGSSHPLIFNGVHGFKSGVTEKRLSDIIPKIFAWIQIKTIKG